MERKKVIIWIVVAVALVVAGLLIWKGLPGKKASYLVSYTITTENGTLIDQGSSPFTGSLAKKLGFKSTALDELIRKIKPGQEKTFQLEPADAYGAYDENLKFDYPRIERTARVQELNRSSWISIKKFKELFNEEPILNKEYEMTGAPWTFKVVEKNDSWVKLSQEAHVNDEIPMGLFSYKVIEVDQEKIKIKIFGNDTIVPTPTGKVEITFSENELITKLTPNIGALIEIPGFPEAKVTGMNETHIFLDANHEWAGQKIIVTVKLTKQKELTETGAAIKGAPTLQVFIMSYCPYGLQMLKGLLPVWEKFKDKANIELRFVSYTMHGEKEEEENKRMVCIREEQRSKLIPYLKCFVNSGDSASCLVEANVDKEKLGSCLAGRAENHLNEDKELNERYGVRGSPTSVLDSKVIEIWPRSPEQIKTVLCKAFKNPPAECSETLDQTNPSPGFGSGASQGGGTCG